MTPEVPQASDNWRFRWSPMEGFEPLDMSRIAWEPCILKHPEGWDSGAQMPWRKPREKTDDKEPRE